MERALTASLKSSAQDFLSTVTRFPLKSSKSALKTLIWSIKPSSDASSTLPIALYNSISCSIEAFQIPDRSTPVCPTTALPPPPTRGLRRSSRHSGSIAETSTSNKNVKSTKKSGKECKIQELHAFAHIVYLCVVHPRNVFSLDDLLHAARELHDHLVLFESDPNLLAEIASICEVWWKKEAVGRENLITQFLPLMLSTSLISGKKVDVHRVYMLREAFTLLDFEDDSIEDTKLFLLRCVISPLYLKTKDGRKFVAFFFGLNDQLSKEILAMIREQIRFGRKSSLEAYSDIVFRAWKLAKGVVLDAIENMFLQGLIDGAIHASSSSLAASIRKILGEFFIQRNIDGVVKLLFRLAEPVIYRSLQVANSNVRLNALHLLLDLFPLEDSEATKEENDTLLDKQFFLLEKLLVDDCPTIRAVAVEGSCRILHLFWEIISPPSITKALTKIFDNLSHDQCKEVKLSVLNGIIYLLGNLHAHEILKVLLPRLGHLISDPILSIRVSVLDLLLLVRDIQSFQFHKVVGMDALLFILANDQPPVAQKVTKLLMPSYFPSQATIDVACDRCITLIKRSPLAGARFCEFALSEGASLDSLMGLFHFLVKLSLSSEKLGTDTIEGILLALSYLCKNLIGMEIYKSTLQELFSGDKPKLLLASAPTPRAKSSVLNIFLGLGTDNGAALRKQCIVLVTTCSHLSEDVEKQELVRSARDLLQSSDGFATMFDSFTRVLQKTASACRVIFDEGTPKANASASFSKLKRTTSSDRKYSTINRESTRRKVPIRKLKEDYAIAAGIAWQVRDMLIIENLSNAILQSKFLEDMFFSLKNIAEISMVHCIHYGYLELSPVLAYMALALHITYKKIDMKGTKKYKSRVRDKSAQSSSKGTLLDSTLDHLLHSSHNLIAACHNLMPEVKEINQDTSVTEQKHGKPRTDDFGHSDTDSILIVHEKISNAIKILTSVLKFFVDTTTLGLVPHKHEPFLGYISAHIQCLTSLLSHHFHADLQIKPILEDIISDLKTSFIHAAKLINLTLSKAFTSEPYHLANHLLDLFVAIESRLGFKFAMCILSAMRPWMVDLVLALGFAETSNVDAVHSWVFVLGSKEDEYPCFMRFVGAMVELGRRNAEVMDALGGSFLKVAKAGMERKEFELVRGVVEFVCVRLVGVEEMEVWRDVGVMRECLVSLYGKLEQEIGGVGRGKDLEILVNVKAVMEPVWVFCYMHQSEHEATMDEGDDDEDNVY